MSEREVDEIFFNESCSFANSLLTVQNLDKDFNDPLSTIFDRFLLKIFYWAIKLLHRKVKTA